MILGATALSGVCVWLAAPPGALADCTITGSGTAAAPGSDATVNCAGTGLTTPITAAGGSANVTVTIGDGTTPTALTTSATAVKVLTGSAITITSGSAISTTGINRSRGAYAGGNSNTVTISGGAISTTGYKSHDAFANGNSNTLTISGGSLSTGGDRAAGAVVSGASNTLRISGGSISTTSTVGSHSYGAWANGTGNTLTISDGSISTTGDNSHGALAYGTSNTLTISGGSISTSGRYAYGAFANGPVLPLGVVSNTTLTISGGSISTSGDHSDGAISKANSSTLAISGGSISTSGDSAEGIAASAIADTVTISGGTISTSGRYSHGAVVNGTSNTLTISGGSISTSGNNAEGIREAGSANTVTISGGSVSTSGDNASGVHVFSDNGDNNTLTISGGSVSASGLGANAIQFLTLDGGTNTLNVMTGASITGGIAAQNQGGGVSQLILGGAGAGTLASDITNFQTVIKNDGGTWTLGGTNTGTGITTTINAGVLQFNNAAAIGGDIGSITVNSGGTAAAGYAIDQAFVEKVAPGSAGVIALAADSANPLDFSAPGLAGARLGATGGHTFSGTLTPEGATYRLGGGGGILTVTSSLTGTNSLDIGLGGTPGGTVVLTGANDYTGATTVTGGTLALNGSIASDVTVNSGGTLGGIGSILGGHNLAVASGGTVAPGNSIGTLTVSGNYTPAAGSFYLVEISPTQSDKLNVTGTATLGGHGTVKVQPLAGTYTNNTAYTILTAGTLTGQFAGVTSLDANFTFALSYVGNNVILTLLRSDGGGGGGTSTSTSTSSGIIDTSRASFLQTDNRVQAATVIFRGGTLKVSAQTSLGQPITIEATGGTIDANGQLVTLTGTITNSGTLTVKDTGGGGNVEIGGALTGGALSVVNGGSANISGTVASAITVEGGGNLKVNGTVAGTVTVADLGVLRGTGAITGPTTIFGTLRPGNSPGTLTFNAPTTQAAGSSLLLDVDGTGNGNGAGNYSRVIVTGAGNTYIIGSGVTIAPQLRGLTGSATNGYSPAIGTAFTGVVRAEGGIVGSFGGLTQPSDGLSPGTRFDTVYTVTAAGVTSSIDLYTTPARYGALPAALGETGNQSSVGGALDVIRPAAGTLPSGDIKTVFDAVYALDGAGVTRALDQIGGVVHADAALASLSVHRLFGDAVESRQAATRAGADSVAIVAQGALTGFRLAGGNGGNLVSGRGGGDGTGLAAGDDNGNGSSQWTGWTRAFGQFAENRRDGNAAGFDTTTGGGFAGIDRALGDAFRVGAGFGYGHSEVTARDGGGRAQLDTYQAALYGGYAHGPLFTDASLGYAYDRYDTKRTIAFGTINRGASARPDGHDLSASVKSGYRLSLAGFTMEPSAGLRYDRVLRAAFTESGANSLNLGVKGLTLNALRTSVGATVSRSVQLGDVTLEPSVRLGWDHELFDETATSTASLNGAEFMVAAAKPGRNAAVAGAGVAAVLDRNLKLYTNYDARVGANQTSHALTAGLKLSW